MPKQVIVVEGKHDEQKIKTIYPDIECIITNGSDISKESLNLIYQVSLKNNVILFLDPDFPGKQITEKILQTGGKFKIAFINKEKAISKNNKKVGIEHASEEHIKQSLEHLFDVDTSREKKISRKNLLQRKLINFDGSKSKRYNLCKTLNIPLFNGKSLLKYLNLLGINIERIDQALEKER